MVLIVCVMVYMCSVFTYTDTHICMYIYTSICMNTCTYTHINKQVYVYIYIYVFIHVFSCSALELSSQSANHIESNDHLDSRLALNAGAPKTKRSENEAIALGLANASAQGVAEVGALIVRETLRLHKDCAVFGSGSRDVEASRLVHQGLEDHSWLILFSKVVRTMWGL